MTIKVGINGFGRIGRVFFRAAQARDNIEIVAVNDLLDIEHIVYMLKYDSTHGKFNSKIIIENNNFIINNRIIRYTCEKDPINLQWADLDVDVVIEATGLFLTDNVARKHICAGAKKVIITAPPKDDTPMFVIGVNHQSYMGQEIISNASCTTNCVAPLAMIINNNLGIVEALMTTVHAATNSQKIIDSPISQHWRYGRSALQNIIPYSTGSAKAVGKIIPELHNKLTGISFRVPTPNVSVIDFTVRLVKSASYIDICTIIKTASQESLKGIVGYTDEDVVSTDFNGTTFTSIFDAKAGIALNDKFVKLVAWYDNETGYSNKILDLIYHIMS